MVSFRRVVAISGILAAAAVITSSHVWGDSGPDKGPKTKFPEKVEGSRITEQLGRSRFTETPVIAYETTKGETLIAFQAKPTVPAGPARPRDYLVLVDTSASKAAGYFAAAQKLAQ